LADFSKPAANIGRKLQKFNTYCVSMALKWLTFTPTVSWKPSTLSAIYNLLLLF